MKRRVTCLAALVGCAGAASASITTFTNRAGFDAAFSADSTFAVQGWDTYADGTTFTNGVFYDGIAYDSSVNLTVVTDEFRNTSGSNSIGRTPIEFFGQSDTITFTFQSPITFFGIDINTFDGQDGGYTATTNHGDVISSFYDAFPGFSTGQFIGFSSDSFFTSVTIAAVGGFAYTLDTMRYGGTEPAVIPLPSASALAGVGLLALGTRRRRGTL